MFFLPRPVKFLRDFLLFFTLLGRLRFLLDPDPDKIQDPLLFFPSFFFEIITQKDIFDTIILFSMYAFMLNIFFLLFSPTFMCHFCRCNRTFIWLSSRRLPFPCPTIILHTICTFNPLGLYLRSIIIV